tara:strand:+ start:2554 stop:2787 length:234 start_codon:yes stop_codon:yes gene_type:complete
MEWENVDLRIDVENVLNVLPERLKIVLVKRFFESKVRRIVASEMGVSISRVKQLESKGLRILRKRENALPIKDYYLR